MSGDLMLKCLIAFILGLLVCRHFLWGNRIGNGFSVGGQMLLMGRWP